VRSCSLPVSRVAGKNIVTIDRLAVANRRIRCSRRSSTSRRSVRLWLNGWVLTAKALLDTNPRPRTGRSAARAKSLVCRCGSHTRIFGDPEGDNADREYGVKA